jgi:hypothetical protein
MRWSALNRNALKKGGIGMEIATAKQLKTGDKVRVAGWSVGGKPLTQIWEVTSIKTWVTRPEQIEVRLKRGLYQHMRVTDPSVLKKEEA